MINSMTGYGQSEVNINGEHYLIEVKTINHRFLDIALHIPNSFNPYLEKINRELKQFFNRGRIEVNMTKIASEKDHDSISIDWTQVARYDQAFKAIRANYPETGDDLIAKMPEIESFLYEDVSFELDEHHLEQLLNAINESSQKAVQMRLSEGEELYEDICYQTERLEDLVESIDSKRDQIKSIHYERMVNRLNQLLEKNGLKHESEYYRELAILAEKGDLTEEIIRIRSHIDQMRELYKQSVPVGRKLDFIVQELMREANTTASKANDPLISHLVVDLKSVVEKIKEQIQNVE
ncbi:TIGR00255 family protein [Pelagirhabdus alkalitolerans]|uniref:TIGR00255 family protein n=1 Tax=Pelagirhabdus alkalitolerans TaxID=1612202 RepID=A0A1G6H0Y6_9BACI|nr:YicC/YloC family endoribonuclease [Pelagirhabdus alkalitolerans]SDB87977.1 TIGR00255 family protein [Pelagirhabdus alkalitolerans]